MSKFKVGQRVRQEGEYARVEEVREGDFPYYLRWESDGHGGWNTGESCVAADPQAVELPRTNWSFMCQCGKTHISRTPDSEWMSCGFCGERRERAAAQANQGARALEAENASLRKELEAARSSGETSWLGTPGAYWCGKHRSSGVRPGGHCVICEKDLDEANFKTRAAQAQCQVYRDAKPENSDHEATIAKLKAFSEDQARQIQRLETALADQETKTYKVRVDLGDANHDVGRLTRELEKLRRGRK